MWCASYFSSLTSFDRNLFTSPYGSTSCLTRLGGEELKKKGGKRVKGKIKTETGGERKTESSLLLFRSVFEPKTSEDLMKCAVSVREQ